MNEKYGIGVVLVIRQYSSNYRRIRAYNIYNFKKICNDKGK